MLGIPQCPRPILSLPDFTLWVGYGPPKPHVVTLLPRSPPPHNQSIYKSGADLESDPFSPPPRFYPSLGHQLRPPPLPWTSTMLALLPPPAAHIANLSKSLHCLQQLLQLFELKFIKVKSN